MTLNDRFNDFMSNFIHMIKLLLKKHKKTKDKDHHQNPGAARLGFQSKQIDVGWGILLILKFFNLVYDINTLEAQ